MTTDEKQWYTADDIETPKNLPEPLGWRILIRPIGPRTKSQGGILLPDEAIDRQVAASTMGQVLKVGNLAYARADMGDRPWVFEGDYVLFGKYAGFKLEVDGVRMVVLNDDEVVAKVESLEGVTRV